MCLMYHVNFVMMYTLELDENSMKEYEKELCFKSDERK